MRAEEQKREKYLPTLLVQQIRLQWYKDCRGGNATAQRNQYPRAMRLPKDFFSYYPFGLPTHFASIVELWDTDSGQLLATIDDPFVVRQVNFAFTKNGLVLHTDYGAMSIYSCAL